MRRRPTRCAGPTWRCCSRSRRCGRARPSRSRCASWAGIRSTSRRNLPTAAASRSRTWRAISSAGSRRSSSGPTRRTSWRRSPSSAPMLHVINALSDQEHPCQALADMMTVREHWGACRGRTLAYVGDGNNVATSLAHAAPQLGISVHVATPAGYELPARVIDDAMRGAHRRGTRAPVHGPSRGGGWRRCRLHRRVDVDGRRK